MITKTIEELSTLIKTGKTPSTKDKLNFEDGEYNWFTPGDFKTPKILQESKRKITDYAAKNNAVIYQKNTILITCIGDIGKAGIIKNEASANQQITGIVVNNDIINSEFFLYWVKANKKQIQDEANQAVVPILNNKGLKRIKVKFPSDLTTQNKIVDLLDKASALLQKRENSIVLFDELLRAKFLDMFGDSVFNPKGWNSKKMKKLGDFKNGLNYKQNENGIELACLGVGDFKNKMQITDDDTLSYINLNTSPSKEFYLKKRDIIFVRSNGNKELVGRCIINLSNRENISYSGFCIRFRVSRDSINPIYLTQLFRRSAFKKKMLKNGRGANIQNINQQILGDLEIPIPKIELQNKFETIYHSIQAQKEIFTQSKTELENLYNSLLQRAFSGQLNFNVDIELDALLASIDLEQDTEKEKHDIKEITTVYAGRLLERLEEQKFEKQTQYQQAKQVVFQMLEQGIAEQAYDENIEAVKIKLV